MDLPSFDILWQTSEKLADLEIILDEIDRNAQNAPAAGCYAPRRRGKLFGLGFTSEDREYYEPIKCCCEDAFYTQSEYETHLATHVPCQVEGCQFVAHQKQLRLHQEVVHNSSLLDEALRETSSKTTVDWRTARKRNYPTLERAATKRELLAQRFTRGQIFKTREFGAMARNRPQLLTTREVDGCRFKQAPLNSSVSSMSQSDKTSVTGLSNAAPCLVAMDYNSDGASPGDDQDVDDDVESDVEKPVDTAVLKVEDDHEEKNDSDEFTLPTNQNDTPTDRGRRKRGGRRHSQKRLNRLNPTEGETMPDGEMVKQREEGDEGNGKNPFTSHPLVQMQAKRKALSGNADRIYSRPTLLHMLLAEDMRTERNQLMQCVRYTIQNNFFSPSSPCPLPTLDDDEDKTTSNMCDV